MDRTGYTFYGDASPTNCIFDNYNDIDFEDSAIFNQTMEVRKATDAKIFYKILNDHSLICDIYVQIEKDLFHEINTKMQAHSALFIAIDMGGGLSGLDEYKMEILKNSLKAQMFGFF
jgi:hypothetical protein